MDVYEKYLPYAIALGVEPEWNKKFKEVIDAASIEQQNSEQGVRNAMYFTNYGEVFGGGSGFYNNFASSINTSTVAPSSSGSGFSGGGGGGGGGGGW